MLHPLNRVFIHWFSQSVDSVHHFSFIWHTLASMIQIISRANNKSNKTSTPSSFLSVNVEGTSATVVPSEASSLSEVDKKVAKRWVWDFASTLLSLETWMPSLRPNQTTTFHQPSDLIWFDSVLPQWDPSSNHHCSTYHWSSIECHITISNESSSIFDANLQFRSERDMPLTSHQFHLPLAHKSPFFWWSSTFCSGWDSSMSLFSGCWIGSSISSMGSSRSFPSFIRVSSFCSVTLAW